MGSEFYTAFFCTEHGQGALVRGWTPMDYLPPRVHPCGRFTRRPCYFVRHGCAEVGAGGGAIISSTLGRFNYKNSGDDWQYDLFLDEVYDTIAPDADDQPLDAACLSPVLADHLRELTLEAGDLPLEYGGPLGGSDCSEDADPSRAGEDSSHEDEDSSCEDTSDDTGDADAPGPARP
jgi:hypothetical protein